MARRWLPRWVQDQRKELSIVLVVALVGLAVVLPLALHRRSQNAATREAAASAPELSIPVPTPSVAPAKPNVLFFGDSVMDGAGREDPRAPRIAEVAAQDLGWNADIHGFPGTGYIKPFDQRPTYPVSIQPLLSQGRKYDAVVIEGSSNDPNAHGTDEQVLSAVQLVVSEVRQYQPQAFIVLIGPYAVDPNPYPQERLALSTVSNQQTVPYIDPVAKNWMQDKTEFISPDNYHPNDAGQVYLGHQWSAALRDAVPASLLAAAPAASSSAPTPSGTPSS